MNGKAVEFSFCIILTRHRGVLHLNKQQNITCGLFVKKQAASEVCGIYEK